MKTGTEIIAREIAMYHGSAMIKGSETLAATRGYGSWGHSPEKYADDHWREYRGAAEVMLARINGILKPGDDYDAIMAEQDAGIERQKKATGV